MYVARSLAVGLACLLLPCGCDRHGGRDAGRPRRDPAGGVAPAAPTGFRFVDVAEEVGVRRVVVSGRAGKDHLLDSAGTGVAFLDYDRDGRLDVYIVNGWRLEGSAVVERGRNALYHGLPDGTFEDATEEAGVSGEGNWGSGAFAVDQNDDGWPDLFVTNFGPNVLYRNRGDGRFTNVAPRLGLESPGWNTGAAFFDADSDGDLDLYVAGYIDCSLDDVLKAERSLDWKGVEKVAFGPFGLKGAPDHFFRAESRDRYVDSTTLSGFQDKALGFGFGVRAADFDDDGDLDLYVANDSDANYFYRNEGEGRFKEMALWSGSAFNASGAAQASMGVATGDVTGDGVLDLLTTHFSEDYSTFYRGMGAGFFEDATSEVGLALATYTPLSWGSLFADLDNDGDLDLAIVNGHIYPQVDRHPEIGMTYAQRNLLFENRGGKLIDVTETAGPGFQLAHSSRGLAAGDYDNDGDLDLLISNLDGPPVLLRNEGRRGSWLTVTCEVAAGGGPLVGTRVEVTTGDRRLVRDVAVGDSFLSTHDPRLHFGLGEAKRVEKVDVRWPDGTHSVREDVAANRFLTIRKGS